MATFTMYTYQFAPTISLESGSLFDDYFKTEQERIMSQKNTAFENAILETKFNYRHRDFLSQLLFSQDNVIVLRIANKRRVVIEEKFVETIKTNEPSTLVIINNDPCVQRIAIEQHRNAFPDNDIVAKIIQNSTNRLLSRSQLRISIRKEYRQTEFWDFVQKNLNNVQMIRFEFDYPNLPRLRNMIGDIVKETARSVGGDKALIQYQATDALNLDPSNVQLDNLNKVSSESGTPIILKIKGQRQQHRTGETVVTKVIDEMEITAHNISDIKSILQSLDDNE